MAKEIEAVVIVSSLVIGMAVYWYFFKKKQEEQQTSTTTDCCENKEPEETGAEEEFTALERRNKRSREEMSKHRDCGLCLAAVPCRIAAVAYCEQCRQFHCKNCKIQHQSLTSHSSASVEEGIGLENNRTTIKCDLCRLIDEDSIVSKLCIECDNKPLCIKCAQKHKVDNATRLHKLTEHFTSIISDESEFRPSINRENGTNTNKNVHIKQKKETEQKLISIELETEYYIRFVLLLIKCGTKILRQILIWGLERENTTLDEFLSSKKVASGSHIWLRDYRKDILYPRPPKQTDINQWDIPLLGFFTMKYFRSKLSTTEKDAVKKIREMRNCHCAHLADACIDYQTFLNLWAELTLIIRNIGHKMEEADRTENEKWMDKFSSPKLDINTATREIKKHGTTEPYILGNIQISLNDILGKDSIIIQDLTVLKKDVSEILSVLGNLGEAVHTLVGALHVSADQQSIGDQAETALMAACKKDTNGVESKEEQTLKQTMKRFNDAIVKAGVKESDVDQGSIIFTFKCISTACILDLLDFFESPDLQKHVSEIAEALKDVIGQKVQLTAYLLRQPLLEILRTMRGADVQTPTGLEGLHHVLKSFEEEGLSKHELSLALSHCLGRRVTLETEVDIGQLQRTIYITKEQLASPEYSQGVSTENMETLNLSEPESENETATDEMTDRVATTELYPIFKKPFTGGEGQELHDHAVTGQSETQLATNVERDPFKDRARLFGKDCPGQPRASTVSADTVTLVWDPPSKFEKDNYYQIYYSTDTSSNYNWEVYPIEAKYETAILEGLKTNTTFVFRVRTMYNDGEGPYSPYSLEITTTESLASRFLPDATKIREGESPPEKYRLPEREIKSARDETNKTKKYEICTPQKGYVKSKTILLIGATGTGKTTLVDGIVNYALGVGWKDSFRYTTVHPEESEEARLINQALSQTDWITCYTINPEKGSRLTYQLHVLDTPGFGDTQGPDRDEEIKGQLKGLFSQEEPKGVNYIDAICFLVKSPDARLTVSQKYVFNSVLSLFGKDVEENICYLITFADNTDPPVLAAMKECELPFGHSFKFNNSALFAKNENANIGEQVFWNMGLDSFSNFFEHLNYVETRSLRQTKEVLDERHLFENAVSNLQPQLDLGMSKLIELKTERSILEKLFPLKKDLLNFEYETVEIKPQKRIFSAKKQAAECQNCYHICYEEYTFIDNKTQEKRCRICLNKCPWVDHTCIKSINEYFPVKVKKQYLNMQRKVENVKGHPASQEQVVEQLELELSQLLEKVEVLMFAVKTCTDRLSEIALRRPNPLSIIDYIDLMIENENLGQRPGFENRILGLKEIRKRTEIKKDYEQFNKEASKELGENKSAWLRSVFEKANNWTTEITAIE